MSASDERALPIPEGLEGSEQVTELARVWWNETRPAMIIRPALRDPRLVGTMLAELAWNFALGHAEKDGLDRLEAIAAIRQAFDEATDNALKARGGEQ